jgi:cell division septation protein DedD
MPIERDIHELLYCHDCVIVPQWGGFLTHYRPARLDEPRGLVHPPGKDTSFNRNLTRNDGLLADHIAKRHGIAFHKAAERIAAEVDQWRITLQRSGRLELPHIGIFYHDPEQLLQFDPDKRSDHLKDAYGLRPVAAVPVEIPREVPVIPMPKVLPRTSEAAADKRIPMAWAAAAVAALLFGAGSLWLGTQGPSVQWSTLAPFSLAERTYVSATITSERSVSSAGLFTLPEEALGVRTIPLGENDSVSITVDLGTPAALEAVVDTTHVALPEVVKAVATPTKRLRFHVIGGCFAQPENAERFLNELQGKGYPAQRLAQSGELHPVAYGSYAERSEALEALDQVRSTGSAQAWLMVR